MKATTKLIPQILILLCFLLVGCVSGTNYTFEQVSQVKLGMTTNEVLKILPTPVRKAPGKEGYESWIWYYNSPFGSRYSSILFHNGIVADVPSKVVDFEKLNADLEKEKRDEEAGRDPMYLRMQYVKDHPELSATDRDLITNGWMRIETAEQRRVADERDRQEIQKRLKAEQMQKSAEDAARAAYVTRPEVPPKIGNAILNHQVVLGMSSEELELSLGQPNHTTRSVSADGVYESWSYPGLIVDLSNHKVKSWTESR